MLPDFFWLMVYVFFVFIGQGLRFIVGYLDSLLIDNNSAVNERIFGINGPANKFYLFIQRAFG